MLKYEWQHQHGMATTYTDSDWAGCTRTGKSTSGGIVTFGSHLIKSYSRQQKTVALSSAEAELHAMVAASAETIGVIALCRDMGVQVEGEVYSDSSAALGIAQRCGSGRVRHIRVQGLWVQEVRSTGRLSYKKVLGSRNPADILTKHVPADLLETHLRTFGVESRDGRAATAPTLDSVEPWTISWVTTEERSKKVRFNKMVEVRPIAAAGRGRSVSEAKRIKGTRPKGSKVEGGVVAQQALVEERGDQRSRKEVSNWKEMVKIRRSWADVTDEEDEERRSADQGCQSALARTRAATVPGESHAISCPAAGRGTA